MELIPKKLKESYESQRMIESIIDRFIVYMINQLKVYKNSYFRDGKFFEWETDGRVFYHNSSTSSFKLSWDNKDFWEYLRFFDFRKLGIKNDFTEWLGKNNVHIFIDAPKDSREASVQGSFSSYLQIYLNPLNIFKDLKIKLLSALNSNSADNLINVIALLLKRCRPVLIHELTHAYQYFVSKDKENFNKGYSSSSEDMTAYLKNQKEIDARFYQNVSLMVNNKVYLDQEHGFKNYLEVYKWREPLFSKIPNYENKRLVNRLVKEYYTISSKEKVIMVVMYLINWYYTAKNILDRRLKKSDILEAFKILSVMSYNDIKDVFEILSEIHSSTASQAFKTIVNDLSNPNEYIVQSEIYKKIILDLRINKTILDKINSKLENVR